MGVGFRGAFPQLRATANHRALAKVKNMDGRVTIEVGDATIPFESNQLPAIGTNISISGEVLGGEGALVTVTEHEWSVEPVGPGVPNVTIRIRTRPHDYE